MSFPDRRLTSEQVLALRGGLRLMALHQLQDADAAEEVAQEALERLLAAIREGRLSDPAKLGAFARSIAQHVIVDVLRSRARVKSLERAGIDPADRAPDALTGLVTGEELASLRIAMGELSASNRNLLRLSYFEGLTCAELGLRLGIPAERIRKRKQRAMDRLRAAFLGRMGHDASASPTLGKSASSKPALGGAE